MAKTKKKITTLDELASFMDVRFKAVDKKFRDSSTETNRRFEEFSGKIDEKMDTRFEEFAGIVNRGFTETQKYIDEQAGKTDQKFDRIESVLKDIAEEVAATHADVRYTRNTVSMLVRSETEQDAAIKDLKVRVHRLEQKAGSVK